VNFLVFKNKLKHYVAWQPFLSRARPMNVYDAAEAKGGKAFLVWFAISG